jgi:DNA-binding helix-hairpin-helix protein with protein kinase domain
VTRRVFRTGSGRRVETAKSIDSGAAGEAVGVKGDPKVALKVLGSPSAADQERVLAMLTMEVPARVPAASAVIAWPLDLVFASDGRYAGFLMPRAPEPAPVNLAILAQRTERETKLHRNMGWDALVAVARNYAAAIDVLHSCSVVACDINLKNVMVSGDQTVTAIDCDSMQFEAGGKRYLSGYHQREFLAPEYRSADLEKTPRTFDSDNWGLAILTWMVLMDGHHPFKGMWGGSGEPNWEDHAAAGRFPYAKQSGKLRPSPDAPPWRALPAELQRCFLETFTDGARNPAKRTSASEWTTALDAAAGRLKLCGGKRQHYFPSTERDCPWCEYESYLYGSPAPGKKRSGSSVSTRRSAGRGALKTPAKPTPRPPFVPPRYAPPPQPAPAPSGFQLSREARLVLGGLAALVVLILIAAASSGGDDSTPGSASVGGASGTGAGSGGSAGGSGVTESAPGSGGQSARPPAPVHSIRAHYRALDDGRYGHAFALMAPSYRHGNRRWITQMKAADSHINLVWVGHPKIYGGSAWLPIVFYAKDTYHTSGSDTACRRFEGEVHMVRTGEGWRYDPADRLDGHVVSSPRCP